MKLTIQRTTSRETAELARQIRRFSEYLQKQGGELFQEALWRENARNLTVLQLRYLEVIEGHPGISPGKLSELFDVTRPTVSNILRGLHQRGMVKKAKGGGDGRARLVYPTAKARRVFEMRRGMYVWLAAHVEARLSAAEGKALVALFKKIVLEEEK